MNDTTITTIFIAAFGVGLLAAVRAGIKSFRNKGKLDASVIADALEAGIDTIDHKK